MLRLRHLAALPLAAAAAIGCDRPASPLAPVSGPDAAVVAQLRRAGYTGPALIAHRTVTDDRGTRAFARGLYLPERGLRAIREADLAGKHASAALQQTLVSAALVAPDEADPAHNSTIANLETVVSPSRSIGNGPIVSVVNFRFSFINYDPATDQFYTVPAGEVMESLIRARDSSAGHFHGSVDTMQLRLPLRVGRLVPPVGNFTGSFASQWRIAEISQEMSTQFRVREIGGPNDGDINWFFSFRNDGVRVQGLTQMPAPGATSRYSLTGGTPTHPEAYNDYATPTMVNAIQAVATAFYNSTSKPAVPGTPTTPPVPAVPGENTIVNDISLFYGGRFDIGQQVTKTSFIKCTDATTSRCWNFSHFEHRYGNEVDIYNENFGNEARKKRFLDALKTKFTSVKPEGNHFHARTSLSVFNP